MSLVAVLVLCCTADTVLVNGPVIRQLGDPTGLGDETLYRVTDLEVDASGNVWVLDGGDRQVKKFGTSGRLEDVFGREGDGPGEFRFPTGLVVDSLVHVMDPSRSRVVRFSLSGTHRETRRLPQPLTVPFARLLEMRGGSQLAVTAARYNRGAVGASPNVLVLHITGDQHADTVAQFPAGAVLWHAIGAAAPWGLFPSPFGAGGAVASLGDSLFAVADGSSSTVAWYALGHDGGRTLLRTDTLGMPAPAVTSSHINALVETIRSEVDDAPRDIGVEASSRWSSAADAFFDHDGHLWLRAATASDRETWMRIDNSSSSRDVFLMPEGLRVKAVAHNLAYGVSRTELDVPMVDVVALPSG